MAIPEKQVQELIADFPWLLNLNYHRVPELKNKGMEYVVGASQRIDLILRDGITERPVIVEFKAVPFTRENIGQILEYRSRLVLEMSREDSRLNELFGDKLSSPVLLLVVSEIDDDAQLACNLSGIEVYEYEKSLNEFTKPEKRKTLEEVTESLNRSALPATEDRWEYVEKLDQEIRELLSEMNMEGGFKKYRRSGSVFSYNLDHFFINQWLFSDYDVSIGICEEILTDSFDEVAFSYYSDDKERIEVFREVLQKGRRNKNDVPQISVYGNDDDGIEYMIQFPVEIRGLLKDSKTVLKPMIQEYASTMNKAFGVDVRES